MYYESTVKAAPADFSYPRESAETIEVVRLTTHADISICTFQLAWQEVYQRHGNLIWPKDIIMSCIPTAVIQALGPMLAGSFLVGTNNDVDEWWVTFIDIKTNDYIDKIFWSAGV